MLKRIYLPGEIYFITTNTQNRQKIFQDGWVCKLFIDVLVECRRKYKFKLYGYVIIPDHVHLLIKQIEKNGIAKFMIRLCTSYSMYFNKKYERIGHLFQDRYKGALVLDDSYLLHLSRYIHLNPKKTIKGKINFQEFTSYPYYLGLKKASWLKPDFVLEYFSNKEIGNYNGSYKKFVEEYKEGFTSEEVLGDLALDIGEED